MIQRGKDNGVPGMELIDRARMDEIDPSAGGNFAIYCPTSGIFYFGMLIPMSAAETGGYLLPAVFAVATGLPVAVVAWILAYGVAGLGTFCNRMQTVQKWLTRIVGLLFIAVGIYYGVIYFC